jgi:hypothetical protein
MTEFLVLLSTATALNDGCLTNPSCQSQSQSYFTTGGLPSLSSSWRQAPWGSRLRIFFQFNTCSHSPYVTSSLTRGWVCRLQLLLVLASADILMSSLTGLMKMFYSLRFETPPTWRTMFVYLYPRGSGRPSYVPRHWVPFPSPFTTLRATVQIIRTRLHA